MSLARTKFVKFIYSSTGMELNNVCFKDKNGNTIRRIYHNDKDYIWIMLDATFHVGSLRPVIWLKRKRCLYFN